MDDVGRVRQPCPCNMGAVSRDRTTLTPLQLRLRAAAMAAGKDLKTVAADIGVSEQTLRQMGGERSKQPNPDRLISAAESTGAPVEWLVAGWEAVVLRSSLPVDLQERADEDALLARISETVDGLADEVSKMRRGQALLADRVRALERGGRA